MYNTYDRKENYIIKEIKMNKQFLLFCVFAMFLSLTSCNQEEKEKTPKDNTSSGEEVLPKKLKENIFRKKLDLQYITIISTSYYKHAPNVGQKNPLIPIDTGVTFDIVNDMGSYVNVQFHDGTTGYLPNDKKQWKALSTIYGNVVHEVSQGKDIFRIEDTKKYLLFPSKNVSFSQLKKYNQKAVKIRGIKSDSRIIVCGIWIMKKSLNSSK